MTTRVFKRVSVYPRVRGGTQVLWELDPMFAAATGGPYEFELQVSLSGLDWAAVTTVSDTYYAQDPEQRIFGVSPRCSYRVTVTVDGASFYSNAVQAVQLGGTDLGIYLELLNKEAVLAREKGRCGYLYKRRHWGERCESCSDEVSGSVINASCAICYGTGFVGGYFPPVLYWLSPAADPPPRRLGNREPVNTADPQTRYGRGIPCPWLDTEDVWVDAQSDQRFFVGQVGSVEYRFVPVAFSPIELRLAPATDVIYTLARPGD